MGLNCPIEVLTQFPKKFENTPLRDHCDCAGPHWVYIGSALVYIVLGGAFSSGVRMKINGVGQKSK